MVHGVAKSRTRLSDFTSLHTDRAHEEAIGERFHKANMYLEILLEVEHRCNKILKLLNRQVCSSKAGD